jgi:hypothetical protein
MLDLIFLFKSIMIYILWQCKNCNNTHIACLLFIILLPMAPIFLILNCDFQRTSRVFYHFFLSLIIGILVFISYQISDIGDWFCWYWRETWVIPKDSKNQFSRRSLGTKKIPGRCNPRLCWEKRETHRYRISRYAMTF